MISKARKNVLAPTERQRVQGRDKAAFHLCSPIGWINDPNGFSTYKGDIHLFFQHHPYTAKWGPMHWGHCITHDFVRWTLLPIALAPDQPYETGCFSGSALQVGNKHALVYTSHLELPLSDGRKTQSIQTQSVAWGDGIYYEKDEENPILGTDQLPEGAIAEDFRDPKVWVEDGQFFMVVGSRAKDSSGQILLYKSDDLRSWVFVTVVDASQNQYGRMWECPDFFALDNRQILLVSPQEMHPSKDGEFHGKNGTLFLIGKWNKEDTIFTREQARCVDYGWDFYAPQTTELADGRRVMIAWMKSWDVDVTPRHFDWSGMMTFPRELFFKDNVLCQRPIKEIENYRVNRHFTQGVAKPQPRKLAFGRQLDMTLTVNNAKEAIFSLDIASDGTHYTRITYNAPACRFSIDRTHAGMAPDDAPVHFASLHSLRDTVTLRLLIDKYSVEAFLNDGEQTVTTLIYTPQDAQDVLLCAPKAVKYSFESFEIEVPEEE